MDFILILLGMLCGFVFFTEDTTKIKFISCVMGLICIGGIALIQSKPVKVLDREVRLTENKQIELSHRIFKFDSEKKITCIKEGKEYSMFTDIRYVVEDFQPRRLEE